MIELKQSPVIFDEDKHTYRLGDRRLVGITGLIHSVLGLGVYPDADPYVKDFVIPKAGSRGTAIHHAIQMYDQIKIKQPTQIVHTKYGCEQRDNISYVDEVWDVSCELENYIHNQRGFKPIANELTVSDNIKFASQIDNVWLNIKTDGIWLVDTKSNNLDLYPLCGYYISHYFNHSTDALKEYLSWQLSIYAVLFEDENPGLKVEGLACNWLRKNESAFWVIERKPSELVRELLTTDYTFTENGAAFVHHDPSIFGVKSFAPIPKESADMIVPPKIVEYLTSLIKESAEIERKLSEAKIALKAAMQQHNVKRYDFGCFSATLTSDTTAQTFDSKRFKADHPELYSQYITTKERKGGITLKSK